MKWFFFLKVTEIISYQESKKKVSESIIDMSRSKYRVYAYSSDINVSPIYSADLKHDSYIGCMLVDEFCGRKLLWCFYLPVFLKYINLCCVYLHFWFLSKECHYQLKRKLSRHFVFLIWLFYVILLIFFL